MPECWLSLNCTITPIKTPCLADMEQNLSGRLASNWRCFICVLLERDRRFAARSSPPSAARRLERDTCFRWEALFSFLFYQWVKETGTPLWRSPSLLHRPTAGLGEISARIFAKPGNEVLIHNSFWPSYPNWVMSGICKKKCILQPSRFRESSLSRKNPP